MKVYLAKSQKTNENEAVTELKEQFNNKNIKGITFFASYCYNPDKLIAELNDAFPNIPVFGCSSMNELINGEIIEKSIVAMAFPSEIIGEILVSDFGNLNHELETKICGMINNLETYYKTKSTKLDHTKYFGLSYFDAVSNKEDIILDMLGNLTNISCAGGSASDNRTFNNSIVYANNKYYVNDGAACTLLNSKVKFGFERIHNCIPTGKKLIPTKVDEANRIIYEFNGQPAAKVYAKMLNIPMSNISEAIYENPLALMIDNELFIRSFRVVGDKDEMYISCNVKENVELEIATSIDIIEHTKKAIENVKNKYKSIAGILAFDCAGRLMEIRRINKLKEYGEIFKDLPLISFFTYGESYIGPINNTLTMLILEEN